MLVSEFKLKVYPYEYKGRNFYNILFKKSGKYIDFATKNDVMVNPKSLISFREYLIRRKIEPSEFITCGLVNSYSVKYFSEVENEFIEKHDTILKDAQGRWQ